MSRTNDCEEIDALEAEYKALPESQHADRARAADRVCKGLMGIADSLDDIEKRNDARHKALVWTIIAGSEIQAGGQVIAARSIYGGAANDAIIFESKTLYEHAIRMIDQTYYDGAPEEPFSTSLVILVARASGAITFGGEAGERKANELAAIVVRHLYAHVPGYPDIKSLAESPATVEMVAQIAYMHRVSACNLELSEVERLKNGRISLKWYLLALLRFKQSGISDGEEQIRAEIVVLLQLLRAYTYSGAIASLVTEKIKEELKSQFEDAIIDMLPDQLETFASGSVEGIGYVSDAFDTFFPR